MRNLIEVEMLEPDGPASVAGSMGAENVATTAADNATAVEPSAGVSEVMVSDSTDSGTSAETTLPTFATVRWIVWVSCFCRSLAVMVTGPTPTGTT